jgi:MoaD family protein
MPIYLKFIGAMRQISGKTQIIIDFKDDMTLKSLIKRLSRDMPELKKIFGYQELNDQQSNSLILINGREISVLNGVETKIADEDEIVFVPVVHGG